MSINPIRDLLKEFINELSSDHTFTQIAHKLDMIVPACVYGEDDKQVESFKVGTLLTITQTFPITIRITNQMRDLPMG